MKVTKINIDQPSTVVLVTAADKERECLQWHRSLKWITVIQLFLGVGILLLGVCALTAAHGGFMELHYIITYESGSAYHASKPQMCCFDGSSTWGGVLLILTALIGAWAGASRKRRFVIAYFILVITAAIVSAVILTMAIFWSTNLLLDNSKNTEIGNRNYDRTDLHESNTVAILEAITAASSLLYLLTCIIASAIICCSSYRNNSNVDAIYTMPSNQLSGCQFSSADSRTSLSASTSCSDGDPAFQRACAPPAYKC